MRWRDDERINDATRTAALSGALSGGILGGVGSMIGGARGRAALIKALAAAGGVGALSGGSTYLGSKVMGAPDEDELHGFTRRGTLGGALGGGALGALGGAAIAQHGTLGGGIGNLVRKLSGTGKARMLKGALAGGLGLGAAGAYQAADEGMQLDFVDQELKAMRDRERRAHGGW